MVQLRHLEISISDLSSKWNKQELETINFSVEKLIISIKEILKKKNKIDSKFIFVTRDSSLSCPSILNIWSIHNTNHHQSYMT
ncbi:hypothetical protein EYC80_001841 [Monilinia laxa]|uniref:Uncharacterized protein n=1 Tax=Monilinia laxa TaxID=61186 RepID=A0A5N6K6Y1_MONLA|nr:hypothetical protein EYC80_001841 [Monilinia laxa]